MRQASVYLFAAILVGLVMLLPHMRAVQPPKEDNKGWVDYDADSLTEKDRLKDRPGNFPVLAAIAEFYDGIYRIRPNLSHCAYPLQISRETIPSWAELDKGLDEQGKSGKARHKLRQYIINIKSVAIHDAAEVAKSAELRKQLPNFDEKRFTAVRKRHPGRAVVAIVNCPLLSLQSNKIEEGEEVLYLVFNNERWRVAWYEKG